MRHPSCIRGLVRVPPKTGTQRSPGVFVGDDSSSHSYPLHAHLRVCFSDLCLLAADAELTRAVEPFLQKHCIDCHGPDVQKARFRLDTLVSSAQPFDERNNTEHWTRVLDRIAAGEMPPAKEERPTADELKAVTLWLSNKLHDASLAHQREQGRVALRRLNKTEYEFTLRDLLSAPD